MDDDKIREIAQGAAEGVQRIIDFTEALKLLKRTADGDPTQLSQDQAKAMIWVLQAVVDERLRE